MGNPHLHTFDRHQTAVQVITAALRTLDTELRSIARKADLQPGDRHRQEQAARTKADQAIRQGRAALVAAIAQDRETGRYADQPDAAAVARRAYYQGQARADLEGRRGDEALAICQQVAASGDRERLAEYVRQARASVGASQSAPELQRLQLEAMPEEERQHRAFGAAVDSMERNLPWLDAHVERLTAQAGVLSDSQAKGWEPEPEPLSPALVTMWGQRLEKDAKVAGARHRAELDGVEPPEWARSQQREDAAPAAAAAAGDGDAGAPAA